MASIKPRNNGKVILDKLAKDLFLKNVKESRKTTTADNFSFNKSRCRVLSKNEKIINNSNGILYWMSRECRVQDNWAMIFAQHLAIREKLPLYVYFLCKDAHNLYPTKRHLHFLLEGLKLVKTECKELNINFHLLNCSPKDLAEIIVQNNFGSVVCDFYPLKYPMKMIDILVQSLASSKVPVVQVDGHNIVPAWIASDKQEGMARYIRPKINKKLPEYLTGFPLVENHNFSGKKMDIDKEVQIDDVHTFFKPRHDVNVVQWGEGPGEKAGLSMLHSFMLGNLKYYGVSSNDPSKDNTSKLSPWIRFGQISAQRCALEVQSIGELLKEQVEKYLEELIVRRELTDNYCFYNENYDNLNGAANWAKETLLAHKKDKRNWVYTREQLQNGETHDECWNAAQMQALKDGKIHGYMRMYWCKKVLEWTESPEQAIEYGLWLNDMYCLDGTDPNGYVGIMWSICGVHDQGWKEREIFGKIRYMVDYSLKKKFDMKAYCARYLKTNKITSYFDNKKGVKRKLK